MLKFDLARKYLVGLLTVAMVFSLFALPAARVPVAEASATGFITMVSVTPSNYLPLTDIPTTSYTPTATFTATFLDSGYGIPTSSSTIYFRIQTSTGLVLCTKAVTVPANVGTATCAFHPANDFNPDLAAGTYYGVAWWDVNGDGVWQSGEEPMTAPMAITWATPTCAYLDAIPNQDTNNVGTSTTHTITITCKDQWGSPLANGTPVSITVNGAGPQITGTATFDGTSTDTTYSFTRPSIDFTGYPNGRTDTIVVTCGSKTDTVYKTWTYTPVYSSWTLTPESDYNLIDQTHTVTVSFFDQYNNPISVTATAEFTVSGANTATGLAKGTGSTLTFFYKGAKAGDDTITASVTVGGTQTGTKTVTKTWVYDWSVEPEYAVNLIGSPHDFVIYGAAGDTISFYFSGYPDPANLAIVGYKGLEPPPTYDSQTGRWTATLQGSTATITVKSEIPGQYYMDLRISAGVENQWETQLRGEGYHDFKVSKAYAEYYKMKMSDPDINPITQTPSDTHTVTAAVLGDYPVKLASAVPPGPAPFGGTWVIIGGVLFNTDVPIQNVPINWKVSWDDLTVKRAYVSSNIDGGSNPTATSTYYFTALSYTDSTGIASLTYKLNWTGTPTGTGSCTLHFNCLKDTITATAQYAESVLTTKYGTLTGSTTKEWRDYSFKLLKYDYNTPPNGILGAKFYLRYDPNPNAIITTSTPTFITPTINVWIPWTNFTPNDPPGVVTTDTFGAAIWYHLPYGTYGLFEYSVPDPYLAKTGTLLYTFTVNENSPYWCNPTGDKQIVHEERNSLKPAQVFFYKIGYCFARLSGVQFVATNLDTLQEFPATSAADGKVSFSGLTYSAYPGAKTWYKVHEISVPSPYYQVNDFYFFLNEKGVWDDKFYDKPDLPPNSIEVWPKISHPELGGTAQHWVVDPKIGLVLSLTPTSQTVLVNNNATLTAKATLGGVAQQGVWIDFFVNGVRIEGKFTDASGQATFTYTKATPGVDIILARSNVYEAQAQVVWTAPPEATVNFSLVQGWNMVTPGVTSAKTAAQIFGANFVHAYHWDPTLPGPDGSLGGWLFCDNQALVPGLGYWVRMSAASTVALSGTPVASPVTQAISKGWNQIGNPFETDLSVANVKIVQGATEKSLADAKAAGWIGNAYSWNGTSYDTLDYSTGTLPAGKGFWLRVLVDGLSIKFTK